MPFVSVNQNPSESIQMDEDCAQAHYSPLSNAYFRACTDDLPIRDCGRWQHAIHGTLPQLLDKPCRHYTPVHPALHSQQQRVRAAKQYYNGLHT